MERVIRVAQRVEEIAEIIVVDDGSEDATHVVARRSGVKVVRHEINSGKGKALQTGSRHARHDHLVFLDADLGNITPTKVKKLINPLIEGEADFVKAGYNSSTGRVTQLVAKPLLKIVYPAVKLDYPLSGEFALNRKKLRLHKIEEGWGIDIQLVLQAAQKNLRIHEVLFGKKEHKHQPIEDLAKMSKEIIRTVLSELKLISHRHKIVVFDLDKTLIAESSIRHIAKAWGFTRELNRLLKKVKDKKMLDREITLTLARHFQGKTQKDVNRVCEEIPLSPNAEKVIEKLRQQRYKVRIVSAAYSPVVKYFATKLKIYDSVSPTLVKMKNGKFSGKLRTSKFDDVNGDCCGMYVCKKKAVSYLQRRMNAKKGECLAIGDGKSDKCLFENCGLSLGYQTDEFGDERIENLSEVLIYAD